MALSRMGENAANVVDAVKEKVEIVNAALPEGVVLRPVYERTDFVDEAINTAVMALIEGSILVAIVLFPVSRGIAFGVRRHHGIAPGHADSVHLYG